MKANLAEELFKTPAAAQWRKIRVRHHHGIVVPLFSLHSQSSTGIGEFFDLIPLIHWCKSLGLDVIQLLPINDCGLHTSPYSALSAFALNPLYISLANLPFLDKVPDHAEKMNKIRYWNRTARVKYHVVRELKYNFFKEYFSYVFPLIQETDAYKKFKDFHTYWLESYALFKSLKEQQLWKHWEEWPNAIKSPSENAYRELLTAHQEAKNFHEFLQFLCFSQMEEIKKIADEAGIFIKGDIPILIDRDSADVWYYRYLFLLHLAAGAPPDMYAKEGQNWGFPLYDWEQMEKNEYLWWKERLQIASHLYHLYRIDHVVGFFRIWGIPLGKSAKEGVFLPENQAEWLPQGKKLMEMMLKFAPILPIGEDLGLVPQEVKQCLYDLGICGTKMMRWERRWDTDGGFIPSSEYEPMTMTTVSTHDSDTLQQWWRHYPKEARLFSEFKNWEYVPFLPLERHKEILWDCHHSSSLFHINLLQEYLCLFPELVSLNLNDERINVPGKMLETNWTYRFRPSVETIVSHIPLKEAILQITGRTVDKK